MGYTTLSTSMDPALIPIQILGTTSGCAFDSPIQLRGFPAIRKREHVFHFDLSRTLWTLV